MIPMPDECTVRLVDMPVTQGGMISEDPDGHVNVYLNARLSGDGQLRAADHEFDHWLNDDLRSGMDIRSIEARDARRLPPLIRARDLVPKAPKRPRPAAAPPSAPAPSDREWADDILFRLPFHE